MKPLFHPLGLTVIALALAACSSPQAPPPQYYQLRLETPAESVAPTSNKTGTWQLMGNIRLPDYLQRDVLWLPVGESGMQPLPGHRWAEPLDEAVPRILLHDLAELHGADKVWSGTLPAGLKVDSQLRVQVLELSATPDRRAVHLSARCSVSTPQAAQPLRVFNIDLSVLSTGSDPDALVVAHRKALWEMARQIVNRMQEE